MHIIGSALLRKLDISSNPLGDEGIQPITEVIQYSDVLTTLSVEFCGISVKVYFCVCCVNQYKVYLLIHLLTTRGGGSC